MLQFSEVWADAEKLLVPSAADGNGKEMLDCCYLLPRRFTNLLVALIKPNTADSPDGEESLRACKSFAIDFNSNSIHVNAAKSLPSLAY